MAKKRPDPAAVWVRTTYSTDLYDLLGRAGDRRPTAAAYVRKVRLLAAAAVRAAEANIRDAAVRTALDTADRAIDGTAKPAEVRAAKRAVGTAVTGHWRRLHEHMVTQLRVGATAEPPAEAVKEQAFLGAVNQALGWAFDADTDWFFDDLRVLVAPYDAWFHWESHATDLFDDEADERAADARLCGLVRDLFGNPFAPVAFDKKWLTTAVTGLATTIHAERAFDRLPVLADALEEAGCAEPAILDHCRGDGEHARGCWVIDGLLGRNYVPRG